MNAWVCARATDSDLDSGLGDRDLDSVLSKSMCIRTRKITFSWRHGAVLTCKSFVTLGYVAVACFPQDSWS